MIMKSTSPAHGFFSQSYIHISLFLKDSKFVLQELSNSLSKDDYSQTCSFFSIPFLCEWHHHPPSRLDLKKKKRQNKEREKDLKVTPFFNLEIVAKIHRFQLLGIYDVQHLFCFTTAKAYLLISPKVFIECHLCARHCR